MRKKLIVANWKSNKNPVEAGQWLENLHQKTQNLKLNNQEINVVICPPYIDLPDLKNKLASLDFGFLVNLGAQDISPFTEGAYTGDVAASQMHGLVSYCLVGHSERRKYFGETTQSVAQKIDLLLKEQIKPIVCAQTIDDIPTNIKNYLPDDITIMFEPARAISVGGVYKAEDPNEVEKTLSDWKKNIGSYQMLYGGSVNGANTKNLLAAQAEGFVVGHASLEVDSFIEILQNV